MESCGYSEDTMIAIRDGEHQLLTDMNMELDSRNNVPHSILHREDSVGCSCQTVVYSPQSGFESRKREGNNSLGKDKRREKTGLNGFVV